VSKGTLSSLTWRWIRHRLGLGSVIRLRRPHIIHQEPLYFLGKTGEGERSYVVGNYDEVTTQAEEERAVVREVGSPELKDEMSE